MILPLVSTYKDITLILTLYLLLPPVFSIFRQNRLVQGKVVAENIRSYPRYSASFCYK